MGKGFVLGLFAALVAAIVGGYFFVASGALPAGQDSKPGGLERWAAKTSLRATMRREARGLTSPLQPTDETLVAGVDVYTMHCQVCHGGPDGTPSKIASGLSPKAPQLAKDGVEDDPEGTIFWKVDHGIRFTGMPGFGKSLSRDEMWQVSLFLKHMDALPPKAGSAWKQANARP